MRPTDLFEAVMEGWGRLDATQRQRFAEAFVKAALRLDRLDRLLSCGLGSGGGSGIRRFLFRLIRRSSRSRKPILPRWRTRRGGRGRKHARHFRKCLSDLRRLLAR